MRDETLLLTCGASAHMVRAVSTNGAGG